MLVTPVKVVKKNGKPVRWAYDFYDELSPKNGEEFSWMKGLGSWNIDDLKSIIEKDGLEKMIRLFVFDNEKVIDEWLGNDSESRKKYILENDFSIAKT